MKTIPTLSSPSSLKLFLDVDGVFANFDKRIFDLTGKLPHQISSSHLWKSVYRDKNFFLSLELMEDAHHLWDYVKQFSPTFLTGSPSSHVAREHKKRWILEKEHILPDGTPFTFGDTHEVIVVPRKDKKNYAGFNHVLIDDRTDNISSWIEAGGIGIIHVDVWCTIQQLESLREMYD